MQHYLSVSEICTMMGSRFPRWLGLLVLIRTTSCVFKMWTHMFSWRKSGQAKTRPAIVTLCTCLTVMLITVTLCLALCTSNQLSLNKKGLLVLIRTTSCVFKMWTHMFSWRKSGQAKTQPAIVTLCTCLTVMLITVTLCLALCTSNQLSLNKKGRPRYYDVVQSHTLHRICFIQYLCLISCVGSGAN